MASKRRYTPISAYPEYSRVFDKLRMESSILNADPHPNIGTIFYDKQNIENLIHEIVGDEDGKYYREGNRHTAFMPFVKIKLKDIDFKFEAYQKQLVNQGYERPKTMPDNLQNERYRIEAQQSVLEEELELLEVRLTTFVDKVQKTADDAVLAHGLCGSACFHGIGTNWYNPKVAPAEIDGQMISQLADGTLYIDDARSVYDGLSLPDYRKLTKKYIQDRIKLDAELLLKMQAEARNKNEDIPWTTGQSFNRRVSKSSLPPFPKEYTNHKAVKVEEMEYKRKPKYYPDSKK